LCYARLDQLAQRLLRMQVVIADVEFRPRLARDHIGRGIADIDRGELQIGRLELRTAAIERLVGDRHDQPRHVRHGIVRAMRIGHMALHAFDNQRAGLRTAAADLDAVAHRLLIARLAQHAMVELVAARGDPLQELDRAIDRDIFLVAGDQERDRALAIASRSAAIGLEIVQHGGDAAGDAALHVDRAAAVDKTVLHLAREGTNVPGTLVARGHHVGVAGECDMRGAVADAGIEIVDVGRSGLAEGDAVHREAGGLQKVFEDAERTGISRRYRRAADEIADDRESIGHAPRLTRGYGGGLPLWGTNSISVSYVQPVPRPLA